MLEYQFSFLKYQGGKVGKKGVKNRFSHTYLSLHSVVLVNGILVFGSADPQNRRDLFPKEITHWKTERGLQWLEENS